MPTFVFIELTGTLHLFGDGFFRCFVTLTNQLALIWAKLPQLKNDPLLLIVDILTFAFHNIERLA